MEWAGTAFHNRCMEFPPPEIAVPPPKVVAPPESQLIFGKIIKTVATRGQILRLKCKRFYFG